MDKKHKGAVCELTACAWLLEQGYEVFRNVSAFGHADIVAWKGDEILKLDVKSIANGLPALSNEQRLNGIRILGVHVGGCFIAK